MKTNLLLLPFVAMLATSSIACGGPSYSHTDVDNVSQSELPGSINVQKVQVAVGSVTTAHIVTWNDDNEQMVTKVESDNPSVLEVSPAKDDHVFAFLGIGTGTAHVTVRADNAAVLRIDATVTEQSGR